MNNTYSYLIAERFNDLLNSGLFVEQLDNFQLAKIFEYYTSIKLSEIYNQNFYVYDDIDPIFKEDNRMSKRDTGIDASNLIDTIVQCKLRKNSLNLTECSTFFASQVQFSKELNEPFVRWKKMFIARNSDSVLSENLQEKLDFRLFDDYKFDKLEMLNYCKNLLINFKPNIEPVMTKKVKIIQKCKGKIISEKIIEKNIITPITLRDYQEKAINVINNNQNVIINLPTATGKNIIIMFSFKPNHKYLILVPRIILMEQLNDKIIKYKPEYENKIQMIGDGNNNFNEDKEITICVYNSVDIIEKYYDKFDKIFIDEAHHINKPEIYKLNEEFIDTDDKSINESSNESIDESNDEINDEINDELINEPINEPSNEQFNQNIIKIDLNDILTNHNLSKHINNVTKNLTNDNEDEFQDNNNFIDIIRSLTKYNNNVYLSATIDETNGFEYYKKDIRDMINLGYLCDYTVHIPIFSDDPNNKKICEYLIRNYRTIIIYCNSCKEGKQIKDIFNELRKGSAEYVDCYTNKITRKNIIKQFKEGRLPFLINVRILTEGFDAKITQGVCFLHMPSNKTTIIQIMGRALRLHPNKKYANIILPYGIKEDETNINKFLKILASNDSQIKKSFCEKKIGGYINIDNNNDDIYDEVVEFRYEQIYSSLGQLLNGEDIWMQKLDLVKKYIDENHKRPSQINKNKEIKILGMWISKQIENCKIRKKIMKNEKIYNKWIEFINDPTYKIYFEHNMLWYTNLEKVKQYIDTNNKRPSHRDKNKEIIYLGSWLHIQVTNSKTRKRIMENNEIYNKWIEFINDPKYSLFFEPYDTLWYTNLEKVKQYINKYNKRPSKHDKNKETKFLGDWLSTQFENSKVRKHIMEKKEIYDKWTEFINDIKYKSYFESNDVIWNSNLEKVKQYIDTNNKRPSQCDKNKEIKFLGEWLSTQIKNSKIRKQIMEKEEIYNKWTEFINDIKYKSYFNKQIIPTI